MRDVSHGALPGVADEWPGLSVCALAGPRTNQSLQSKNGQAFFRLIHTKESLTPLNFVVDLSLMLIRVAAHDFDRTTKTRSRVVKTHDRCQDVPHSLAFSAFTSIACCTGAARRS
jgi:hypothetical protein